MAQKFHIENCVPILNVLASAVNPSRFPHRGGGIGTTR